MARVALRRQLLLVAIVGVLPLAILVGAGLFNLFEQQRLDEQRRALEISRALATAVEADLKRSMSALQVLAVSNALAQDDIRAFDERARRAVVTQPNWRGINLADLSGNVIVSTRIEPGKPIPPLVERGSFEGVLRTREPQVGPLALGPREYAFALRVPVIFAGELRYVLSAVIEPRSVLQIVQRQKVPDEWVISVFDAKGSRVARSRAHEETLAGRASPGVERIMAGGQPEGTGITQAVEGDTIFTAFVVVPDSGGWKVALGLPVADTNRRAVQSIAIAIIAILFSLVAGLAAAFVVARRINEPMAELGRAARTLGGGGVPTIPATEIREIDEVGEALVLAAKERQAHEAELENASRAKDQFLAMLAHELRNPLAALSNASTVLSQGAAADPNVTRRAGEVIQRQVVHLARLTDDLLETASALLGKIELREEPVDLARIASQVLATFRDSGKLAQHQVSERLEECWVSGDPIRLDQVVSNLVGNAVKFTPAGGTIELRTARAGGDAVLTVRDSGVGLSADLAVRAFDLFVQGDRSLDRGQGGLGIGLTLVRRLAELHRGTATVTSAGENQGSEFVVRLPGIDRPAQPRAPAVPRGTAGVTVLVVEDNEDARESLAVLLRAMGHQVECAGDGLAGVDKALADPPDVTLVDLGMPRLDGFEVARRLRARGLRSYLVALTGYGSQADREHALEAGFDEHATKPVDYEALSRILARAADAASRE
jgi:signal transduction histidine kinase